MLDQVTSNTALRLPISEIGKACRDMGIIVILDGAHVLNAESASIYQRRSGEEEKMLGK